MRTQRNAEGGANKHRVKTLLGGALSPERAGYFPFRRRGRRVSSAYLEDETSDAARESLRSMRDAQGDELRIFADAEEDSSPTGV